jgi:phosphate transport system substrate-binding protein
MSNSHAGHHAAPFVCLLVGACLTAGGCRSVGSPAAAAGTFGGQVMQNKGSDTMLNLALAWSEAYQEVDPRLDIAVTGGGSGTGIAGLLSGTVDVANASRALKEDEIADAEAHGFTPEEHTVAVDALAIIVNPANPVSQLSIQQVADIYTGRIQNWNEVGGRDAPIVRVSRETNSGTHVYFLEEVIRQGQKDNKDIFAADTLLMPSSVGITSEVRRNPNAIGYDGLGYVSPAEEKILALGASPTGPFVLPSVASATDGSYPLSRPLYMVTAGASAPEIADYLTWITGPEGQAIVSRLGFVPIGSR